LVAYNERAIERGGPAVAATDSYTVTERIRSVGRQARSMAAATVGENTNDRSLGWRGLFAPPSSSLSVE
jgi:hypothetical protein